jgi:hypothetical protein
LPFFTLHHLPSTLHSPRDCRGGRDLGGKRWPETQPASCMTWRLHCARVTGVGG